MFHQSIRPNTLQLHEAAGSKTEFEGQGAFNNGANHGNETSGGQTPFTSDLASQGDQLVKLINELRSITDRACEAAVRESECADRLEESRETEIARLQVQLKEKEESLAARNTELREKDEIARAKIQSLEMQLRERQTRLELRETEVEELRAKLQGMATRLQDVELQGQEMRARLQTEIEGLNRELKETRSELQDKDHQLRQAGGDLKAKNQDLEARLQDMESQLQSRESELKEKDHLIEAAAGRETEIGKLIARLSEECGKLSAELHEKSLIIAQLEKKQRHFIGDGAVWKKVLGRSQEQAQ